jgi:hypothetical protein
MPILLLTGARIGKCLHHQLSAISLHVAAAETCSLKLVSAESCFLLKLASQIKFSDSKAAGCEFMCNRQNG